MLQNKNEVIVGAKVLGGSSKDFNTGSWRINRPIIDSKKCINCMLCFLYCPDDALIIKVDETDNKPKIVGVNLDHCKGCSICANVCPVKCINMKKEEEFHE